jgi:hypothetical protein
MSSKFESCQKNPCEVIKDIVTNNSHEEKRIDELDDISGQDLIKRFETELPTVYRYNLDNYEGVVNNNFPSDGDIRWILRQNREENKFNENAELEENQKSVLDMVAKL